MRVLLLDEDIKFCRSLAELLDRASPGARVDFALSVQEAAAQFVELRVDVLFVDGPSRNEDFPGSRLRFVSRMRALGSGVPTVLMSDADDDRILLRSLAVRTGAQAWLSKVHADVGHLRQLLEQLTDLHAHAPEARNVGARISETEAVARDMLTARAGKLTARTAYNMAIFARAALREPDSSCAIEARRMGIPRTTLRPYALLTRWTENELDEILHRRGPNGGRITASHLLLAGRLAAPACTALLARVLAECLSVRRLREILHERTSAY